MEWTLCVCLCKLYADNPVVATVGRKVTGWLMKPPSAGVACRLVCVVNRWELGPQVLSMPHFDSCEIATSKQRM